MAAAAGNLTPFDTIYEFPTAAVLFSFVATCQRDKVNVFEYLRDMLTRIAAPPMNHLAELLPDRWQPLPLPNTL